MMANMLQKSRIKCNICENVLNITQRFYSNYKEFQKLISDSKNIVAVTGAGISAESGIPVFRGAGGWWRTHRATDLATLQAFNTNPSLVWEFYHYRREIAIKAQPNQAHLALAKYEAICKKEERQLTVITQNVDGLHQRAGSEQVLELHGSLFKVICTTCKQIEINTKNPICEALAGRGDPNKSDLDIISKTKLPRCSKCEGLLRPYIVWFGENLDSAILHQTRQLVENCDLCLVIGTSSVVYPAAMLAPMVAQRGKPVAEFNLTEDPFHDEFSFCFSGPCGTSLPKALGIEL